MELRNPNFSDKAKRDFELVKKARQGKTRAYAELLGYYKEPLFYMLLRMVGNKEDAEDLTLEAFEKAFRKLSSYMPGFAFSTWLFKIATNCGIDFLRSKRNQSKHLTIHASGSYNDYGSETPVILEEDELNPEERVIKNQQFAILRKLIEKMPPDYRRILTLRYFEELSYNEISEKLDVPIGTVKTRLFRSKELLESMLKDYPK